METIINKIINLIKIFWMKGTSQPVQRVGLIILAIGVMSCTLYSIQSPYHYEIQDILLDPDYYPRYRDPIFYKLYVYFIPLGLLLSWGYSLLVKLKIWVMGGNKNKSTSMEVMHFKDNEAAFEMVSKYMDTSIIQDKPVVAISMQDMKKPSEPIMIKVAGDPPFYAHTATHYTGDHLIKKGDLLGVMPFTKTEHITSYMENDERKQWLFLVVSELNPKFHMGKKMWSIKQNFIVEAAAREKAG